MYNWFLDSVLFTAGQQVINPRGDVPIFVGKPLTAPEKLYV